MNNIICLDSNIIIKFLTWEADSERAVGLVNNILQNRQTILLPDFASVEVGSVLRKKVYLKIIHPEDADLLWNSFLGLGIIKYIESIKLIETAWRICKEENLPVLYDAAYLAVSVLYSDPENICEFWTADQKMFNAITIYKKYLRHLSDLI
ncbi:MAG: type II toxin-antitoxin system VapC family toxin [Firmicutes bacterium]|nr:type II toxin-antitoxin system VapC family toxin [Bacillota bacterium]